MQFTPFQQRMAAWAALTVVAAWLFWLLAPVLAPFVVAAVVAYVLTPLVNRLDALWGGRLPRVLAVVMVELLFLVVVLGVVLMIVPILAKELPLMRDQLPQLLDAADRTLKPWLAELGIKFSLDVVSIKAFVLKHFSANLEDAVGPLMSSLALGGSVALAVVGNLVLIPVVLFYLLMVWEDLWATLSDYVPPRLRAPVNSFVGEANEVLSQYMRGQLLVMGVLAVYYSLGLALFGLDLALPIGVFTGIAVAIPYLGFGIGLVLATLSGFLQFLSIKALVMVGVVYGAGQIIEGFFLTPRLVGERIGLHPLAVIFALLAFGQLLGFVGVLVALPASAVLLVAFRRLAAGYRASSLYSS